MLKYFSILFFLLMATSCSNASSQDSADTKTEPVHSHLAKELALAEQAQDYRLLVTATRGLSVPGLVQSEFKSAIALCGKRYMPNTGDVIKTAQDRDERKKMISYMQQYNAKIWSLCRSNKADN